MKVSNAVGLGAGTFRQLPRRRDEQGLGCRLPARPGMMVAEGYGRIWKERREVFALETSVRGVFAAGDLRAGPMNRAASAVGEGSMVVRLVTTTLR